MFTLFSPLKSQPACGRLQWLYKSNRRDAAAVMEKYGGGGEGNDISLPN
jgi:hypothetical protein